MARNIRVNQSHVSVPLFGVISEMRNGQTMKQGNFNVSVPLFGVISVIKMIIHMDDSIILFPSPYLGLSL